MFINIVFTMRRFRWMYINTLMLSMTVFGLGFCHEKNFNGCQMYNFPSSKINETEDFYISLGNNLNLTQFLIWSNKPVNVEIQHLLREDCSLADSEFQEVETFKIYRDNFTIIQLKRSEEGINTLNISSMGKEIDSNDTIEYLQLRIDQAFALFACKPGPCDDLKLPDGKEASCNGDMLAPQDPQVSKKIRCTTTPCPERELQDSNAAAGTTISMTPTPEIQDLEDDNCDDSLYSNLNIGIWIALGISVLGNLFLLIWVRCIDNQEKSNPGPVKFTNSEHKLEKTSFHESENSLYGAVIKQD